MAVSISDKIFPFTHLSRQTRCHNCDKPARARGKRTLLNKHHEDSVPLNVDSIWVKHVCVDSSGGECVATRE